VSAAEGYTPTDAQVRNFAAAGMLALGGELARTTAADRERLFERWLAKHDAELKAAALWEAASDIKDRIRAFRDLNADSQYDLELNDAWGLVANRARTATKESR